ncbi:hypothetical protein GCM10011491_11180 [Brucella endophytica]|uniref:Uncharacterized protein n=1 Tax=Brucella endophytica TaxID=1963359 RepID=A0A916S7W2_9HYPH|nr:hypothetical protein GCM10011491_11180 [Brucella endophytica]
MKDGCCHEYLRVTAFFAIDNIRGVAPDAQQMRLVMGAIPCIEGKGKQDAGEFRMEKAIVQHVSFSGESACYRNPKQDTYTNQIR